MTPRRKKRLAMVSVLLAGAAVATALLLSAFSENLVYFYTPTEVATGKAPADRKFRLGGMVADGSVQRADDSLRVRFEITDSDRSVPIVYDGVLPDLFREGQGIVADGTLNEKGAFVADTVLAKHDENYMPPEAAEAMKRAAANREKSGGKPSMGQEP